MVVPSRDSTRLFLLGLLLLFLISFSPHSFALINGQAANLVIGQSNFTTNTPATTSTELNLPAGVTFDSRGNLWVADVSNNRVLEYNTPFSTHEAASIVIGQSSVTANGYATDSTGLHNPTGVAFDSSGNLWVVDSLNSRVLKYTAPLSTHEAASLVLGQPNFISSNYTLTNSSALSYPTGLGFDSSGNLWVADSENDRVLEYAAPLSTYEAASLVIGQPNFATNDYSTTRTGLNYPNTLAFDSGGNLWVSDFRQSRVLEYTVPFSTHEAASIVIGQPSFTTRICAYKSTCAANSTVLFQPYGLAFDSGGNLWVADQSNNRVLEYAAPLSTHEAASIVIGQPSFTSNSAATTRAGLSFPGGLAFDSGGNLWVADSSNSRVLEYGTSSAPPSTTVSSSPSTKVASTFSIATSTSVVTTSFVTSPSTNSITNIVSSSSTSTSSTSKSGAGGVPEFPFQFVIVAAFTISLVSVTLVVRKHSIPKA